MTDLTWLLILAAACVLVLLVGALLAVAASRTPTNASRHAKTAARPAPDGDEGEPLEPDPVDQHHAEISSTLWPHGGQADDRGTSWRPQTYTDPNDELFDPAYWDRVYRRREPITSTPGMPLGPEPRPVEGELPTGLDRLDGRLPVQRTGDQP